MIIKQKKISTGEGNYMCQGINVNVIRCDTCDGQGYLEMSFDEMVEYLRTNTFDYEFRKFRKFVKDNIRKKVKTKNGVIYEVICQDCGGRGEWEEWY